LQRDKIVSRALEIADAEGLDAVTFRRLAADFGVTPMALYRHVTDRKDLLTAMADLVMAQVELPNEAQEDWAQALREVSCSALVVYSRHPAARALSSASRRSVRSLALTESLIGLLTSAGFTAREGLVIIQRLGDAALAETWALLRQPMPGFPGLEAAMLEVTPQDARLFGIDLVIAGAQALAAERSHPHPVSPGTSQDERGVTPRA
jgi:AcrR family transcriptional regulator